MQIPSFFNWLAGLVIAGAILIAIHATGSTQQGHNPFPGSTPAPGETGIVDVRRLEADGTLVALSPDGQWIAGIGDDNQFCVWEVVALDPACDDASEPIDPVSIAWARDSTAVAYSLDALIRLYDSDIFVFELGDGRSVNLTGDGFQGGLPLELGEQETIPVDLYPAWSADGQALTFARTGWSDYPDTNALMRIERAGGEPLQLAAIPDGFGVFGQMAILEDGSVIFAIAFPNGDGEAESNGLWLLAPGGALRQVMSGATTGEYPIPQISDIAIVNDEPVVVGYSHLTFERSAGAEPAGFVLTIDAGTVVPMMFFGDPEVTLGPVGMSPDSSVAAAVVMNAETFDLAIIGTDPAVTTIDDELPGLTFLRAPEWAANDTVLLSGYRGCGVPGHGGERERGNPRRAVQLHAPARR